MHKKILYFPRFDFYLFADYDKSKVITYCVVEMILSYFIMRASIARRYNENGRRCYLLCYHVKRYYRVAV